MKKRLKIIIPLILLALVVMLIDSNVRLVCTKYEITSDKLPESFDGFKIVQLSDLHEKSFGEGNKNLISAVKEQVPDVIAITGDIVDKSGKLKYITSLISQLSEIAPVYYVTGNHEWATDEIKDIFNAVTDTGGMKLRNTYDILERNGEKLIIAGIEDPNGPRDMRTPEEVASRIEKACGEVFTVLLAHRNDAKAYESLNFDVIICGHAHGGIIRLPIVGGLLGTNHQFFPEYAGGCYDLSGKTLIVSRGLGNSNSIPRFMNNPEITVITLKNH